MTIFVRYVWHWIASISNEPCEYLTLTVQLCISPCRRHKKPTTIDEKDIKVIVNNHDNHVVEWICTNIAVPLNGNQQSTNAETDMISTAMGTKCHAFWWGLLLQPINVTFQL